MGEEDESLCFKNSRLPDAINYYHSERNSVEQLLSSIRKLEWVVMTDNGSEQYLRNNLLLRGKSFEQVILWPN
jgi:hypothetical protein